MSYSWFSFAVGMNWCGLVALFWPKRLGNLQIAYNRQSHSLILGVKQNVKIFCQR